jgi:hypothetical protein
MCNLVGPVRGSSPSLSCPHVKRALESLISCAFFAKDRDRILRRARDRDRGVYESLDLRVAQHPSELTRNDGQLYVAIGGETLEATLAVASLVAPPPSPAS